MHRLGGGGVGREEGGYDISLGAEFDWRAEGAEFDRQPIGQL